MSEIKSMHNINDLEITFTHRAVMNYETMTATGEIEYVCRLNALQGQSTVCWGDGPTPEAAAKSCSKMFEKLVVTTREMLKTFGADK